MTAGDECRDALVARLAGRILREPVPGWCADCQASDATVAAIVTVVLFALEEEGRLLPGGRAVTARPERLRNPLRAGPILSCPAGHPVRYATQDEVRAAVLDPGWEPPTGELKDSCLFCGPSGRARIWGEEP